MPISRKGNKIFEQRPWLNDDLQNVDTLKKNLSSGTLEITENGVYDVTNYAVADVDVSGGGSSDLSTATLTIHAVVSQPLSSVVFGVAMVDQIADENCSNTGFFASSTGDTTVTVILYKGTAYAYTNNSFVSGLSGDIEFDEDNSCFWITGDCALTLSDTE